MADDKLSKIFKLLDKMASEEEKPSIPLYESTDDSNTILNNLSKPNFILLKKLAKKYNESPLTLIKKISGDGIKIGKEIKFNEGGLSDNKVGTKINKTTQAGRDVYETPEGEMVSEKSTTFKYDDKWINVPSIFKGYRYNDDTIRLMLDEGIIKPTSTHNSKDDAEKAARKRSNELEFNEGGTPMMNRQMEMFEDGGLKDEGGMTDSESGNDVPVGSTRKEVRDDIPAQLSEGEFVFPADVVRYIGLEKLMGIRQQAKMGLQEMEAMGQMGNSDEATMPDDLPFNESDLIIIDGDKEVEMAKGGVLKAAEGTDVKTRVLNPSDDIVDKRKRKGSFNDLMGGMQMKPMTYENNAGSQITILHVGGSPIFSVPAGYKLVDPDAETTDDDDIEGTGTETTSSEETDYIETPDYGGDLDDLSMVPGSVGSRKSLIDSAINMANIVSGQKKPSAIEKFIMNTWQYKAKTNLQMKAAGITDTGDPIENQRQLTMYNIQTQMDQIGTEDPSYGSLADSLANTREYTVDEEGDAVPTEAHPSRKTSVPTTSKYYDAITSNTSVTPSSDDTSSEEDSNEFTGIGYEPASSDDNEEEDSNEFTGIGYDGGSGTPTPSAVDMGGPDVGGGGDGSGGGNSDGSGSGSGGVSGDMSGPFNKGGLAGKKPKSKKKQYKKGGLATSKK